MRLFLIATGNEIDKGLRFGWAERKQIVLEMAMFVPMFLLFAGIAGRGQDIVGGTFEWEFDERRTSWLLIGFMLGMYFFLQAQKLFWRLLAEIQTGTLEQVYLSRLPSWVIAAAARLVATVIEAVVVVGTVYTAVGVAVGVDIDWDFSVLIPVAFTIVGGLGYSLAIGALTLVLKRTEVLNDMLHMFVFFAGGMMVSLDDMPAWIATVGRILPITHPIEAARSILLDGQGIALTGDGGLLPMIIVAIGWLIAGGLTFHLGDRRARRAGTLIRY